jgi:hypothetical protein
MRRWKICMAAKMVPLLELPVSGFRVSGSWFRAITRVPPVPHWPPAAAVGLSATLPADALGPPVDGALDRGLADGVEDPQAATTNAMLATIAHRRPRPGARTDDPTRPCSATMPSSAIGLVPIDCDRGTDCVPESIPASSVLGSRQLGKRFVRGSWLVLRN